MAQRGRKPKPTAVKELEELGVLTEVNMADFAGYCEAMHFGRKQKNLYENMENGSLQQQ